eukprot:m.227855 g.227855  ORF g.227855 m.227855 type:complete len:227 (-) comp17340_c0_seq1:27-707(-)
MKKEEHVRRLTVPWLSSFKKSSSARPHRRRAAPRPRLPRRPRPPSSVQPASDQNAIKGIFLDIATAMAEVADVRRRSSLFALSRADIAATSQVDHSDQPADLGVRRPRTPYENTYKMKPSLKFSSKAVEGIIETVLKEQLEEEKYDAKASKQITKTLATIITSRVKALGYENYKIVTLVSVGQVCEQGLRIASRCLFDPDTDSFASGSFKNASLFGTATVFALYYE